MEGGKNLLFGAGMTVLGFILTSIDENSVYIGLIGVGLLTLVIGIVQAASSATSVPPPQPTPQRTALQDPESPKAIHRAPDALPIDSQTSVLRLMHYIEGSQHCAGTCLALKNCFMSEVWESGVTGEQDRQDKAGMKAGRYTPDDDLRRLQLTLDATARGALVRIMGLVKRAAQRDRTHMPKDVDIEAAIDRRATIVTNGLGVTNTVQRNMLKRADAADMGKLQSLLCETDDLVGS